MHNTGYNVAFPHFRIKMDSVNIRILYRNKAHPGLMYTDKA